MSLRKLLLISSAATLLAAAVACASDEGDDDDDDDDSSTANGITPCGNFPDGPKSCQAGQYCADEGFSECQNGCLSQTNCTSAQTCQKAPAEDVGSCQGSTPTVTCADVCAKLQACDPSVTQAECDQFCAGTNDVCKSCLVGENCPALLEGTACMAECGVEG